MGLRHLPGAPAGVGWGKEGKRHGEADEKPGQRQVGGKARVGRLLCSWKSSSPKEKAQPLGCGCIPSPLSVAHQQLPGQCCPRSLAWDCSLSSRGCRSQPVRQRAGSAPTRLPPPRPPGSLCPQLTDLRAGGPGWPSWQDVTSTRSCVCSATSGTDLSLSSAPA